MVSKQTDRAEGKKKDNTGGLHGGLQSETDRRLFQNLPDNGLRELKCKGAELEN